MFLVIFIKEANPQLCCHRNSVGVQVSPSINASGGASSSVAHTASSSDIDSSSHASSSALDIEATQSSVVDSAGALRVRFPRFLMITTSIALMWLIYLSELSFARDFKLVTARCYRRWLAAYLDMFSELPAPNSVTDIFIAELTSKKASGGFRYKHGELVAALIADERRISRSSLH